MALPNTRSAQAVKPKTEINEMQSLQLTRNLIRIAISEISYIRGLFPEKYFLDRYLPALEMKVKKLMPVDAESRRLIDWMEKGVYDALQKKYLETLLFRLCDGEYGPMIEEYAFCFRYDISSEHVSMDITRSNGHGGKGNLMRTNSSDITPAQMKAAACKMIRTLVQLMRTLNNVPQQRTIIMQLYYHADTTPANYEPPFFRSCTYEDNKLWAKKPLKMKVGNVNSKHFEVSLKVRSILDPCEDEVDVCVNTEDKMDYSSSTGTDAPGTSHDFTSHVEIPGPSSTQYSPLSEKKLVTSTTVEDVQQICRKKLAEIEDDMAQEFQSDFISAIKEWAIEQQSNTFDEIHILASFPHIPMTLLQELVGRLVKERFLEKHGTDKYRVSSFKEHELSCKDVGLNQGSFTTGSRLPAPPNTEYLGATSTHDQDTVTVDDEKMRLYEKALALVLRSRMKHVTVRDLTYKLGENLSTSLVNYLLQRMGKEGYIEITPASRRLGRRVLRPLQEPEDDLLEIVEGVKDVVIAEADDGSERSSSDDAKVELRTKSRADFINSEDIKKSSELRSKNKCDSLFNALNPDPNEPRTKKKADATAITTFDTASREHISDNPTSSLRNTSLPTERADDRRPTKITEDECPDREPFSPDNSTTERHDSHTISREERVGLPMSSYDVSKSQNTVTVTDTEKNLPKSHHRIRKASKVEEPIYQSLNSTKRMRA